MHNTEPQVYLIAKTKVIEETMREWLDDLGADKFNPFDGNRTDGEQLIEAAGRRCYMSFQIGLNANVTRIREDVADYITNILKVGHGSILEHVYFTFAIENVSRVFTGEMNRHRAGMAISEGSMRFIRFDDIPYWVPASIREDPEDSVEVKKKKERTRELFAEVFAKAEDAYTELVDKIWDMDALPDFKSKKQLTSCLRRIIPMGVSTGGVWTGNVRALRHICQMRCAPSAEEEIAQVATAMLMLLQKEEPNLFADFKYDEAKGCWKAKYKKV